MQVFKYIFYHVITIVTCDQPRKDIMISIQFYIKLYILIMLPPKQHLIDQYKMQW